MRASGFMVSAAEVVTATPADSIKKVMDLMLQNKVGAVVIVNYQTNDTSLGTANVEPNGIPVAIGMVTKSDLLQAYSEQVDIHSTCDKIMGDRKLVSCHPADDRDRIASILEKSKTHHVIVVDEKHGRFVGLVSSWDVAAECAKDNRVWPYLRGEDGKIPFPEKVTKSEPVPPDYDPRKPTSILNHEHDKSTGSTFMDDLDLEAFQ